MEIYKDIIGFEGKYQISNNGNVRSLDRTRRLKVPDGSMKKMIWGIAPVKGKILIPFFDKRNRPRISLCKKKFFISHLVAQNFIEYKTPNNKLNVVNHIDNNPSNNNVDNLEWVTQKKNIQHSIKQGRHSSITRWK